MPKVCVLGLGYIGLPTTLLIANAGVEIIGFDIDLSKIKNLKNKKLYFSEKNLDKLFNKNFKNIKFTHQLESADIFLIAVPTPQKNGSADLKYVFSALDLIKDKFKKNNLIILESTVGPRDCIDKIVPYIKKWGIKFNFAHCPERAIPGNTLYEMVNNDRIIGCLNQKSQNLTKKLYKKFIKGKLYFTDLTTAESCKVMENTFRAVNIALANEFAILAEKLGFDVWQAIKLANKHPRVNIHQPGPGVGGHCIPIDPYFLISTQKAPLTKLALDINHKMAKHIASKINNLVKTRFASTSLSTSIASQNPKIAILGYAYKKNVDDARETPAANLIKILSKTCPEHSRGKYKILITDSYIKNKNFINLNQALKQADIIILITDHDIYQKIKFENFKNIKFVLDTRNLFTQNNFKNSPAKLIKLGVAS